MLSQEVHPLFSPACHDSNNKLNWNNFRKQRDGLTGLAVAVLSGLGFFFLLPFHRERQ